VHVPPEATHALAQVPKPFDLPSFAHAPEQQSDWLRQFVPSAAHTDVQVVPVHVCPFGQSPQSTVWPQLLMAVPHCLLPHAAAMFSGTHGAPDDAPLAEPVEPTPLLPPPEPEGLPLELPEAPDEFPALREPVPDGLPALTAPVPDGLPALTTPVADGLPALLASVPDGLPWLVPAPDGWPLLPLSEPAGAVLPLPPAGVPEVEAVV